MSTLLYFFFATDSGGASSTDAIKLTQESLTVAVLEEYEFRLTQMSLTVAVGQRTEFGFDDCGIYEGPREWEVRIYSPDGLRKSLIR